MSKTRWLVCTECNAQFQQEIRQGSRTAFVCSPKCKKARINRLDRESYTPKSGRRKRGTNTVCEIDGCDKDAIARGLCGMHWARWNREGDPGPNERRNKLCRVIGCEEPKLARGYCNMHYIRVLNDGDPGPVRRKKARNGEGNRSGDALVIVCDTCGDRFVGGEPDKDQASHDWAFRHAEWHKNSTLAPPKPLPWNNS